MNIFMMILVAVFMVGMYFISSPSVRTPEQETTVAVTNADIRGVAECTTSAHSATIKGTIFDDICVAQNGIESQFMCLNSRFAKIDCEISTRKKPEHSFVITTTAPIAPDMYNDIMNVLEKYYADSGTFGIYNDGTIILGGGSGNQKVPQGIIKELNLTDGQLIYMTQYKITDAERQYTEADDGSGVICPAGTEKTFRFGRWQCIGANTKTTCGGDMIWSYDLQTCIADESRKPLCGTNQTAVIVDDVWECINPFPDKECPGNTVARLNYNTMEWECVSDPNKNQTVKKCAFAPMGHIEGHKGTTLRRMPTSCTDCEQTITNEDTCEITCIPDPSKTDNPICYPGNVNECSGKSRALYFGFPDLSYAKNVSAIDGYHIPLDDAHNQNRKFNCLDCGAGEIDTEKSLPPYIAICK